MTLSIYTLNEYEKWDEIVKTFKDHDIYYLSSYLKSLKINGDGDPLLFYYKDDGIKAINVMLKRDVADEPKFNGTLDKGKYFDFTSPYGYGGWIIEGDGSYQGLIDSYESWCKQNNIICEFVRFHPLIENQKYSESFYEIIPLGKVIALDTRDYETMWKNMSSRNRNKIKKAINNGVTVSIGSKDKLDTFIKLYEDTMTRDNAEDYYFFKKEYYDIYVNEMKNNALLFSAEKDGKTLSSCIAIFANNRVNYHLSGSTRTSGNIYETNLLLYRVGCWANEHGFDSFLLGGGVGSHEDALYQFKKGFDDKHAYQFYIGKKMYRKDLYDELVSKRDDIENPGYFPSYRG